MGRVTDFVVQDPTRIEPLRVDQCMGIITAEEMARSGLDDPATLQAALEFHFGHGHSVVQWDKQNRTLRGRGWRPVDIDLQDLLNSL